jgi:pimeloyl-ACP methyl ester carboxylesterase
MVTLGTKTRRQVIEGLIGLGMLPVLGNAPALAAESGAAEAPAEKVGRRNAWLTLPLTPPLPVAVHSGLVQINGTEVFYAQFGSGPPVLMLHGGLANSNWWGHQIKALAGRFSVTVMDTRGHGRSPVTSPTFNYPLFAADAAALLDHLGLPAVAVIGWSDGAITGFEMAMARPEKVARLFSFAANSSLDGMIPGGSRSVLFTTYTNRCRHEYASLSPHPERWPQLVHGLRQMWRGQASFPKDKLAALKMPVTVCAGDHDEIIKREHTQRIAAVIPGAKLVLLAGVSHFAMLQDPEQFSKALVEFLDA